MTSIPVHIFTQMRNAVSQCRSRSHDVRCTSVLRQPKRSEDSDATAWIVSGSAPYISFISHSFPLSSFTSHRIFLRQRHH